MLADLGARVVKVEDATFKDPFVHGLFADMDASFPAVYRHLNRHKEIRRLDFKSAEGREAVLAAVRDADALIMGPPPKVRRALGLDGPGIASLNLPLAIVEAGTRAVHGKSMHDVNALAETGLLKLHVRGAEDDVLPPPFMPAAGIALGARMATDLLACLLKARRTGKPAAMTTYLFETTERTFGPFWPEEVRNTDSFLHNGLYPATASTASPTAPTPPSRPSRRSSGCASANSWASTSRPKSAFSTPTTPSSGPSRGSSKPSRAGS